MLPIWVLNLAHSVDRRRHMEEQLTRLGLTHERIEAVDGEALTDSQATELAGDRALAVQPWLGRPLTRSEIGCALAHAAVWRRLAVGSVPAALVLEDDVDVSPRLPEVLRSLEARGGAFDLVLLGHHSNRYPWIPGAPFGHRHGALTTFAGQTLTAGVRVGRLVEYAQGAYAYVLTQTAARHLLDFAQPIRMPADSVTGYAPRAGIRSFAVTPPVVVPAARFATTMKGPRPCPCRVCSRARMRAASGVQTAAAFDQEQCLGERTSIAERARALGGRAFLLVRRLGIFPGSFWAPPLR